LPFMSKRSGPDTISSSCSCRERLYLSKQPLCVRGAALLSENFKLIHEPFCPPFDFYHGRVITSGAFKIGSGNVPFSSFKIISVRVSRALKLFEGKREI
jgi:hypothetical protein